MPLAMTLRNHSSAAGSVLAGPPRSARSMPEMPNPGEHHGKAAIIGGGDDLCVPYRATWLDDGRGACIGRREQTIYKGKKGIGSYGGASQRATAVFIGRSRGFFRFPNGEPHAVDPAHLSCADANGCTVLPEDNRVRAHMLGHAHREDHIGSLMLGGL